MVPQNEIDCRKIQFIQRPAADLSSGSQRFAIYTVAPKHRLPGRFAQPEGKFYVACAASYHLGVCGAR